MSSDEGSLANVRPNGAGAAAVFAAGIGSLVLAVVAIGAERIPELGHTMNFYKPTGPLSGVTTTAILLWLAIWAFLHARWRKRTVGMGRIGVTAFVLLCVAVLLTFPPLADLL
jgi:hypothetical protein